MSTRSKQFEESNPDQSATGPDYLGDVLDSLADQNEQPVNEFCRLASDPASTVEDLVEHLAVVILTSISASGVAVAVERDGKMVCVASGGTIAPPIGSPMDVTTGLTGECYRTSQRCRCDDTQSDRRVNQEAAQALGIGSLLVAPVIVYGRVQAILEAFSSQPFYFSGEDATRLDRLASALAEAMLPQDVRQQNANRTVDAPEPIARPMTPAASSAAAQRDAGDMSIAAFLTPPASPEDGISVVPAPKAQGLAKAKAAPENPAPVAPAPVFGPALTTPPASGKVHLASEPAAKTASGSSAAAAPARITTTPAAAPVRPPAEPVKPVAKAEAPKVVPAPNPRPVEVAAVAPKVAPVPAPAAKPAVPPSAASTPAAPRLQPTLVEMPVTFKPAVRKEREPEPAPAPEVVTVLADSVDFPATSTWTPSHAQTTAPQDETGRPAWLPIAAAVLLLVLSLGGYFGWRALRGQPATATAATTAEQPATQPAANAVANAPAQPPAATGSASAQAAATTPAAPPKPAAARTEPEERQITELAAAGRPARLTPSRAEEVSAPQFSASATALPALGGPTSQVALTSQLTPPRLIQRKTPAYPYNARNSGIGGEVVLRATVGTDGRVRNVEVMQGHPLLRQAAADAVSAWRYEPAVLNGQRVEAPVNVTLRFNLAQR